MLTAQQSPASAFDLARWKQQDYAASARWEQQQAYQRYRQDKWADLPPEKKPFWKQAKD